jgi:hypothetical protein
MIPTRIGESSKIESTHRFAPTQKSRTEFDPSLICLDRVSFESISRFKRIKDYQYDIT